MGGRAGRGTHLVGVGVGLGVGAGGGVGSGAGAAEDLEAAVPGLGHLLGGPDRTGPDQLAPPAAASSAAAEEISAVGACVSGWVAGVGLLDRGGAALQLLACCGDVSALFACGSTLALLFLYFRAFVLPPFAFTLLSLIKLVLRISKNKYTKLCTIYFANW